MTSEEAEKIEALLVMLNKIVFLVGQSSQGDISPEVAMAEIPRYCSAMSRFSLDVGIVVVMVYASYSGILLRPLWM